MIIHYTHTIVPNSGELKRMKNIDRDVVDVLNSKSIEVEFYPLSKFKYVHTAGRYTLSKNVIKKYYVPTMRFVGRVIHVLVFAYLILRYKPTHVIGEMVMLPQHLWIFRLLNKNCKLIFDIHGAAAEECEYQGLQNEVVEKIRRIERTSVQKVDYVICQSDEMSRYLQREYNVSSEKICVYRCGVDTSIFNVDTRKRIEIRKKLGFADDEYIFVYSGGLHPWQRVGESIDLFERYHAFQAKSKLLVLTASEDQLHKMLKEKNIDNSDGHVLTACLPYSGVPSYLNACDIAFLLRHNHPMNAVASPTKLAEYLACGLPIISSEVSRYWVNEKGLKYILISEESDVENEINQIIRCTKKREVESYAIDYFSLDLDKKNVKEFFSIRE